MENSELRELLTTGCRILGAGGQADLIWGHLSVRDPQDRGVWMKASSLGFGEVTPMQTVLVDWDGRVLAGEGRRHLEYPIHTEIMRARKDVSAVAHTHSPAAVALGATGHPLQPLSHEGSYFTPPDIQRFTATSDLIVSKDLGRELSACLGDRNAALMVNHGIVVAAEDLQTAVVATILLDRACEMQLRVLSSGGSVHVTSDEEAIAKRRHCYSDTLVHEAFDHLARML